MEFRWVAAITLWTFIAGPAFGPPPATNSPLQSQSRAASVQQRKAVRHVQGNANHAPVGKKDAGRS